MDVPLLSPLDTSMFHHYPIKTAQCPLGISGRVSCPRFQVQSTRFQPLQQHQGLLPEARATTGTEGRVVGHLDAAVPLQRNPGGTGRCF